jgi:hypothetical protein
VAKVGVRVATILLVWNWQEADAFLGLMKESGRI